MLQNSPTAVRKTIYLIRHGETDYNRLGIVQGAGVDTPLNDTGRGQASAFFRHHGKVPFDKVYISSLRRTRETVAHFTEAGILTEVIPELNEINWGILEGQKPSPEISALFLETVRQWQEGNLDFAVERGETPRELQARQAVGLEKILSRSDEETILICMHGRAMRSFLCLLTDRPLERMDDFGHSNVCLYILHQLEDGFHVVLDNDTEHLR